MPAATALIDANNFYASCEQSLDPSLIGRPVVVLSNNDGCIVARSAEARTLGIAMGTPFFKAKRELERQVSREHPASLKVERILAAMLERYGGPPRPQPQPAGPGASGESEE